MLNENGLSFEWGDENEGVNSLADLLDDNDDAVETEKEEKVPEKGEDEFFEGNELKGKEGSLRELLDDDSFEDDGNSNSDKEESENNERISNDNDSPYSDFLKYLQDGAMPEITDEQIKSCKDGDDLSEILQSVVEKRLDDETKAIRDSRNAGVDYTELNTAKGNLEFLNNRKEDILSAEGDEADAMRKNLLMYYFNIKGYDQNVAEEEVNDIFTDGKEIDKLKRYLPEMIKFNENKIKEFNKKVEDNLENQKKQQEEELEKFKKEILDEKTAFGDLEINRETKNKIFEYATKPTHKDPNEPNKFYTELDWQIKQNPFEWKKLMALVGVITDGGKNLNNIAKVMANKEVKKEYKNITNKLKNGNFGASGGNMRLVAEYDMEKPKYNKNGERIYY